MKVLLRKAPSFCNTLFDSCLVYYVLVALLCVHQQRLVLFSGEERYFSHVQSGTRMSLDVLVRHLQEEVRWVKYLGSFAKTVLFHVVHYAPQV